MSIFWSVIAILIILWLYYLYRTGRLEEKKFTSDESVDLRLANAIEKQMTEGTFTLKGAVDLAQKIREEDAFREQFAEVSALVLSANGLDESKHVMQIVRSRYPDFAVAMRHQQIVEQSIDIVEKTKNRQTLESRIEVIRQNQTAMFDALPFEVGQEARDRQSSKIDEMLRDGLSRLKAARSKKEDAPPR